MHGPRPVCIHDKVDMWEVLLKLGDLLLFMTE